jgi:hypothetical protein
MFCLKVKYYYIYSIKLLTFGVKKIPLIFILLFLSCSAPRQLIVSHPDFSGHPPPYHISSVGIWNSDFNILTLIDGKNAYFTVQVRVDPSFKIGNVYAP